VCQSVGPNNEEEVSFEVLMAVTVASSSMTNSYRRFGKSTASIFRIEECPEDGDSTYLRYVIKDLRDYKVSHHGRQQSSARRLFGPGNAALAEGYRELSPHNELHNLYSPPFRLMIQVIK
jgi:hypothetical protein